MKKAIFQSSPEELAIKLEPPPAAAFWERLYFIPGLCRRGESCLKFFQNICEQIENETKTGRLAGRNAAGMAFFALKVRSVYI